MAVWTRLHRIAFPLLIGLSTWGLLLGVLAFWGGNLDSGWRAVGWIAAFAGGATTLSLWSLRRMLRQENWLHGLIEWAEEPSHALGSRDRAPIPDATGDWGRLSRALVHRENLLTARTDRLARHRRNRELILNHMAEGVIAISDGKIVLVNPSARRLLGLDETQLIGRHLVEVVRIPELTDAVAAAAEGGESQELNVDPGQSLRWHLRAQCVPLPLSTADREAAHQTADVVLTLHDQTQSRQLDQIRREFVSSVSHELKTPLTSVKGYAETLQSGALEETDTARRFVDQIVEQAGRLERLIADMLVLSRAQAGSQVLATGPMQLKPLICECIENYRPLATNQNIDLQFNVPPDNAVIIAERTAVVTIVNNLLGNALRYTPAGGRVTLQLARDGDQWCIVVEDTGIGISTADQPRIFERFYRVDKARDQSTGGTGLGLAIVKNLVNQLDGSVSVRSEPGAGSRFEVRLRASD